MVFFRFIVLLVLVLSRRVVVFSLAPTSEATAFKLGDWQSYTLGDDHSTQDDLSDSFISSESIVQLTGLVPSKLCKQVATGTRRIAYRYYDQIHSNTSGSENKNKALIRLPTIAAAKRAALSETPFAESLDAATDSCLQEILQGVLGTLDVHFSEIVQALFLKPGSVAQVSLLDLYRDNQLSFASREPAINFYTCGGKFHAHTDGQQLTVLIPLTDQFHGGGTAFWSESQRHRLDPPAVTCKPVAGTVLLFGGQVMHAGLPVEDGERIVLVASFSRKK